MEESKEFQKLTPINRQQTELQKCSINELKATRQFSQLTVEAKEIFESLDNIQIKNIEYKAFVMEMNNLIMFAHSSCGQLIDEDNHVLSLDTLCSTVYKYNGTFTMQELRICFLNGIQNKYGEYYGLNNKTYFNWINSYWQSDNRNKAVLAIKEAKNLILNPPPPPPTSIEIQNKNKELAIKIWKDVKEGKDVFDVNNIIYDYLDGLKLIKFTGAEKKSMMEIVREQLIDEEKNKLMSRDKLVVNEARRIIETIRFGDKVHGEVDEKGMQKFKTSVLIVCETKRYALKQYFKSLIDFDLDFETVLEEALFKNI